MSRRTRPRKMPDPNKKGRASPYPLLQNLPYRPKEPPESEEQTKMMPRAGSSDKRKPTCTHPKPPHTRLDNAPANTTPMTPIENSSVNNVPITANTTPMTPIENSSVNNVPIMATEKLRQEITQNALRYCGIVSDPPTSLDTRTLEALYRLHVIKQLSLLVNHNARYSVVDGPDIFKLQIWRGPSAEHEREEYLRDTGEREEYLQEIQEPVEDAEAYIQEREEYEKKREQYLQEREEYEKKREQYLQEIEESVEGMEE